MAIVVDYSGVGIAAVTACVEDLKMGEEHLKTFIPTVIISSILNIKKKFSKEYGEVIVCTDSSPYWRTEVFPYYKIGRDAAKEKSDLPWELIYKYLNITKIALKEHFPYKVLMVPKAEADDLMAIVVRDIIPQFAVQEGLFSEPEKCLIVSNDKDMSQLMSLGHVKQYSPRKRMYAKLDCSVKEYLRRLILTGDAADFIPNVFSPNDSFYTKTRQKAATEKKMLPFLEAKNLLEGTDDPIIKKRIIENNRLVNFNAIPSFIINDTIDAYNIEPVGNKMSMLKYFSENRIRLLMNELDNF